MGHRTGRKKRKTNPSGINQRHPSGRLYEPGPKEREDEIRGVVIDARQRIWGMTEQQASFPEAGSVVGRLRLSRTISAAQAEAALKYAETMALADAAILAKRIGSSGDLNRSRGHDDSDGTEPGYVAKCKAAIAKSIECHRALREAHQLARWAVDTIVLEDQPIPADGELRLGLNALCRVFKIPLHKAA